MANDITYTIEIVFDLSQREYCSTVNIVKQLCEKYNAKYIYTIVDPDINTRSKTCICTAHFEQTDLYSFVILIREIKILPKVYIESISKDDNQLLYVSKSYLKLNNNNMKRPIKQTIKKNIDMIYNDDESVLIKEIKNMHK